MSIDQLFQQATKAIEEGNHTSAIELLSKIIDQDASMVRALGLRGISYRKNKNFEAAIQDFDAGLALSPDASNKADLQSEKGVTLFHQQLTFEALQCMNTAVDLQPQNPYRYSSRAYIKDALKDLDGAIADYQKAIELDPEDAIALNNLGMLEEKKGNLKKAKQHFDKSDELEGVDLSKINLDGEAQKNGGTSLNQTDGKKEVLNLSELRQKQNEQSSAEKKQDVVIKEAPQKTIWQIIKGVFTDKTQFQEFVRFVKGLFSKNS